MDEAQSEPSRPTDPDMLWTGWALHLLREAAEIDLRAKRMAAQQQSATPAGPEAPDFALMQSRLSRSLRLSIAMSERIRADYLLRKADREGSGEQERRRQRREQAAEAVVRAAAAPGEGWGVEHTRSAVWEKLIEDEILDAQLDTLSPEEFVQAVCRKIGRPPPSIPLPQSWNDAVEAATAPPAETADHEPAEGRPQAPDELVTGRPTPKPTKPDSS